MSNAIVTELDDIIKQAGYTPYTWEVRDNEIWVRHIVSGGVNDPVYGYSRVGTIDETQHMVKAAFLKG